MSIPSDPVMLLSYINTQLRDKYSSLDALCEDLNVSSSEIITKLESINYTYNQEYNKFM